MKKTLRNLSASLLLLMVLTGCANSSIYHKNFMRGQVVSASDSSAVICIGSYKNELLGKSLNVYQILYEEGIHEGYDNFTRVQTGVVKIDSIINEHFARATVTSGTVLKNNMVELSR